MQDLIFWTFASLAIIASLLVIFAKNPVRAVLSLIIAFLATAAIWLLLEAEFLAITLVLVYVGAVMVFLLFVVMMLDIDFIMLRPSFTRWLPIGILLAMGLFFALTVVLHSTKIASENTALLSYGIGQSNTEMLGSLVFTKYLLQFEIAGVLLLVAIVAAIGLIYRGPQARKVQNINDQINVRAKDRVHLVDGN